MLEARPSKDRDFYQDLPDAVLLVDGGGFIVRANGAASELLGYEVGRLEGLPVEELVPESLRGGHREFREAFQAHPGQQRMGGRALSCLRADGQTVPVDILLKPVTSEGRPQVLCVLRDMRGREGPLLPGRRLFEAAPDAVLIVDRGGRVVDFNGAACRLFGREPEDLRALCVEDLIPSRFREAHRALRAEFQRRPEGRPLGTGLDLVALDASGREIPVDIKIEPLGSDLVYCALRDMTRLRAAEEERSRLLAALRHATEGIAWVDREGRLGFLDDTGARLLGLGSSEAVGRPLADFLGDLAEPLTREWEARSFRVDMVRNDGSGFPAQVQTSPEGEDRLYCFFRDATAEVGMEVERARARLAEASSREKGRLVAVIGHDQRTLMNIVLGAVGALSEGNPSPEQRDLLDMIEFSAQSMLDLLGDLMDVVRLEQGELTLREVPFRLRDLAGVLSAESELLARLEQVPVVCEVDPEAPEVLVGDPRRIHQVLLNLVTNGLKFTSRGRVTVRLEAGLDGPGAAWLRASVTDTGIGISQEQQAGIFHPFSQLEPTAGRGFGLGLAICRELAELMGGSVQVESEPGRGSTFRFEARLRPWREGIDPAPEPLRSRRGAPAAGDGAPGCRVLAVEDSRLNQLLLGRLLEAQGCRVTLVPTGEEALEEAAEAEFDLVLLDLGLPGMSGLETARRLLEARPDLPVVALTADPLLEDRCRDLGLTGFLTKPVDPEELRVVVQGLSGRPDGTE